MESELANDGDGSMHNSDSDTDEFDNPENKHFRQLRGSIHERVELTILMIHIEQVRRAV